MVGAFKNGRLQQKLYLKKFKTKKDGGTFSGVTWHLSTLAIDDRRTFNSECYI